MQEITRITLETDMDLVLVHKRTMKLGELAGLSLAAQTTFATAVSEVARHVIEYGYNAALVLGIRADIKDPEKFLIAKVFDRNVNLTEKINENLVYARKLVDQFTLDRTDKGVEITLEFKIPGSHKIISSRIEQWISAFSVEQPLSPYDEIKRKNKQLHELAEKLKDSETQYREVTNALPLMIFSLNDEGEILYSNSWLQSFTGYDAHQLNENKWKPILREEEFSIAWEFWWQHVAERKPFKREMELRNQHTGEFIWHLVSLTPVMSETANISYWTGSMVDIHAHKVMEQTLRDNKELQETKLLLEEKVKELNRSNQELEQFAYAASHDLQEPLRKIVFYSDYLNKHYAEQTDERGKLYFGNMMSASQRMTQLIHDLLNFSRIYRENLHLVKTDLNIIASEAMNDLDLAIKAKHARVEVISLPVLSVYPMQMRQLFQNLLSNAIKFSDEQRSPVVKVYAKENAEQQIQLIFEDNGVGFEEKYLDKMFSLFQRLHSREKYAGTGIGLAMCKKIVDLHNGSITASSQPGIGAKFIVTLPPVA
ncbi:ATP-binding protein [Chitinophaga rhizophila]|uniref:histidine kinase n=1 Tax=Chitinophaga rhizophila TaxID=2866212 RepID=A0ABS7GI07_9BACT|nr:ATP-binding protein [Chitinophaga rhizophila]MBW8686780.1 PAS domain S-box protein [Chitinophaga rhizophila]